MTYFSKNNRKEKIYKKDSHIQAQDDNESK